MKMVSVFATKFTPDLDAATLANYVGGKLGRIVNCQRIETLGSRYSSFKVWAECNEVQEMYRPDLWPAGSVVRRYYESRKVGVMGTASSGATVDVDAQNAATADLSL